MSTVAKLLTKIDAFLQDTDIAETTFGRLAVNDGKFVGRLRGGSGITVAMVDRVHSYIAAERAAHPEWKRRRRSAITKKAA